MHDDCLYEDDDVKEALRRLPEKLLNERNFRIVRAMQLQIQHDILPKDKWTKYEEVNILLSFLNNNNNNNKQSFVERIKRFDVEDCKVCIHFNIILPTCIVTAFF